MKRNEYDFCGWATRNNLRCSDGRVITRDAFKANDNQTVPLVWNHDHSDPHNILGHALLENRDEGVYAYCAFNDSESGNAARDIVRHGDITALSIYANNLKQQGSNVLHGAIREVSLVLAGANPGAFIDSVIRHGEEMDDEAIIYTGENIVLYHADDPKKEEEKPVAKPDKEKTVGEVFDELNEEQKTVVYAMIGQALEAKGDSEDDDEEGDEKMKHNVFDRDDEREGAVLRHFDQESILKLAKSTNVGSLRAAIDLYAEKNNSIAHGFDEIETLFPDYKDVRPGAPELLQRDQGWVSTVMQKAHKSPISRIRTRYADARGNDVRAKGYKKGEQKQLSGNVKLLRRTTDPQTVYRKDALERDDIVDITDFDVVEYQYGIMRQNLNEEVATAIMIGDGREDGDESKIYPEHIRPIWLDDDLYTIHVDVDVAAARKEIQGSGTGVHFGDNYVYSEAIITSSLYAREQYKGSGTPDFFCTPHLLNVMLLARDRNGRRIYDSKSDLAAALNVGDIYTAEKFEGKIRTTKDNKKKKLLGLFVNLADYHIGSTKGGEITRFDQFDIDFNQYKYLIEARLSGALTRVYSAIALEESVDSEDSEGEDEE